MRRLLMIVSAYEPAVLADMHRARLLCQELPAQGWQTEVLAPDASFQRLENLEPDSAPFFSAETIVHRVGAWHPRMFQRLGMRSIGWRALEPMYRRGCELLAGGNFDLVYITTASFNLFCLGRLWRRFGVPYVLDFHDPWHRDTHKHVVTKHRWKYRVARTLSSYFEAWSVERASGIVSVSPRFLDDLLVRYRHRNLPWMKPSRHTVIPFAASERDLQMLNGAAEKLPRAFETGLLHVVYVGAGGAIMASSFRALCRAIVRLRERRPALAGKLRIHLYGTQSGSKPGDKGTLVDIAQAEGAADVIEEQPHRQSYYRSLQLAAAADGLLVLGVDDAGYTPSKLFGYLLSGKPVLACFHRASPAAAYLEQQPGLAQLIRFGADGENQDAAAQQLEAFLTAMEAGTRYDRADRIRPFLAPAMAARHAEFFAACLND